MKVLTVLGLLLAISIPASALTFNQAYEGPINMNHTFLGADDWATAGPQAGSLVHMAVFKVDTIYGLPAGGVVGDALTNVIWSSGAASTELVGIYYGLVDDAWRVSDTAPPEIQLFGNQLEFTAYEVPLGTWDTAAAKGINGVNGVTWSANTPGVLPGLTDVAGSAALTGIGRPIIDPQGPVLDFGFPTPAVVTSPVLFEQKTEIEVTDAPGAVAGSPDPLDTLVKGSSTAYLEWTGGDFFNTLVGPIEISFTGSNSASPVYGGEVAGRTAHGQASQDFKAASGTAAAVGWQVVPQDDNGSITANAIPEPLTMIALFGGVAGLGGYIRKRRMA